VIDFFRRLFGQSGSSSTAKERLRLVLMTDHLELAPDMIEAMKRDLVDVISRFVEVDRDKIEVNFEQRDKALAMLANIPILSVNRPNGKPVSNGAPAPAAAVAAPGADAATPPATGVATRKRRRRKKAKIKGAAPAPETVPAV
jgi:cell division topological specificity factor